MTDPIASCLAAAETDSAADEEEPHPFDFATTMREIHAELAELNAEATVLAAKIQENFGKLGI